MAAWALAAAHGAWADDAPAPLAERVAQCSQLPDDLARLRCYDRAARAGPAQAAIQTLPEPPAEAARARPRGPAPSLRFDLGYGFSAGDYVGTIGLPDRGALKVDSATGGAGGGAIAEAWLDDWPRKDMSLGLEYIDIHNLGSLSATLPGGLAILTDPVYAHLGLEVKARVGMLNIAYRPRALSWLRPVLGVGVGGGYGYADETYVFANPFLGQALGSSRSASPFPMVQAFAGVDADLSHGLYLSLTGRLMAVSGHPIGLDQGYADFVVGAAVGYKFK